MKKVLIVLLVSFLMGSLGAAGKLVVYQVDGNDYEGYYVSPDKKAPLILLVHDWDGLTDYEIKRAEMLVKEGYAVFALDMFGKGIRPKEFKDKKALTGALYKDRPKMIALLNGGLNAAKSAGGNIANAIIMGYCFGGTCVLEYARSGKTLKGFVTFHGGLSIPEGKDYTKTKGKLLILHGTADKHVTMEHFSKLAVELESKKIIHEMVTYSGAPHAFSVFGSERYRKDADEKSWARFTGFLNEVLKSK
ncbi:MAG: dienelactone hydrolase [Planctomycetota bacterium]|nr:MAG: dienelactone hydrolase [Planctomycetota bacterium]